MSVFVSPSNERDIVCYLLSVVRWIIHHRFFCHMTLQCNRWMEWIPHSGCWVLGKAVSRHSLLTLVWPHKNGFELGITDYLGDKQLSQPVVRLRPWEGLAVCSWLDAYYFVLLKCGHQWSSCTPQLPVFQTPGGRVESLCCSMTQGVCYISGGSSDPGRRARCLGLPLVNTPLLLQVTAESLESGVLVVCSVTLNHAWSLSWVILFCFLTLAVIRLYSLSYGTAWPPREWWNFGCGPETCSGPANVPETWDISRYDANWCCKCVCTLGSPPCTVILHYKKAFSR